MFRVSMVVICEDIKQKSVYFCLIYIYLDMYLKISETLTDMSELLNGQIDSWTEISSRASLYLVWASALNFLGHCCLCLLFFFSSEELLERHISCNVLPSHQNHELFLLPSTHSSLLSSTASSSAFDSHTHTSLPPSVDSDCCPKPGENPLLPNPHPAGKKRDFMLSSLLLWYPPKYVIFTTG